MGSHWELAELALTYRDLEDKLVALVVCLEGVQNWGELGRVEFHCKGISDWLSPRRKAQVEAGDVVD